MSTQEVDDDWDEEDWDEEQDEGAEVVCNGCGEVTERSEEPTPFDDIAWNWPLVEAESWRFCVGPNEALSFCGRCQHPAGSEDPERGWPRDDIDCSHERMQVTGPRQWRCPDCGATYGWLPALPDSLRLVKS